MKDSSIWNEVVTIATRHIAPELAEKWLRPLAIHELRGDIVTLIAPNRFYKTWVEDNYIPLLKKILNDDLSISAPDINIILSTETKVATLPTQQLAAPQVQQEQPYDFNGIPLYKDYTFENFVHGSSNSFAYSACIGISKGLNNLYNPLYIYGDVGLGKTHLMQAVGNALKDNFPRLRILYTTGEMYMNEFFTALRRSTMDEFKQKYCNIDVLLFDDVQFIADKTKCSEEFFFAFSQLHATQKQIILTSNRAANEIPSLDRRLSSRFSSGLTVDIQKPSVEEKEAIITKRFISMKADVKRDVIRFIAENIRVESVRELIGLLITLHTQSDFQQKDINIDFVTDLLGDYLADKDKSLSHDTILNIVSAFFQLKPIDLKSKKRSQSISYPRNIAMYILRNKSDLSLAEIGELFDRDHTTVLHSVKKMSEQMERDGELKGTIEMLESKLKMLTN